nr:E2 protein precursor [synthetic construct]
MEGPTLAVLGALLAVATMAQGFPECKEGFQYAISKVKKMGLLGPESLTTTWHLPTKKLVDSMIQVWCEGENLKILKTCTKEERYLVAVHERALSTSAEFMKISDGAIGPDVIDMPDDFEFGLCPCDSKPIIKGKFNASLLNGPAFQMVCPQGWTGTIECTLANQETLDTTVVRIYRRTIPFQQRKWCAYEKIIGEDIYECILGGNWTCIAGDHSKLKDGPIKKCKWCGYDFFSSEGLPHYPIGKCMLSNESGYRYVDDTPCDRGGVAIVPTGTVKCRIGNVTVQVIATNKDLGPMPCSPNEVIASEGPVEKTACTFNYSKTLPNKYYEPRDRYFQQYMLKGEWQYWFDLDSVDHHKDYFSEFIIIAVVALLGGKYVLWLLVTYMILSEQMAMG